MYRNLIALAAAASLVATPALAQSEAASALSVQRAAPVSENANELNGGSWFAPAVAIAIVVLGILTATGVIFDDDDPDSP